MRDLLSSRCENLDGDECETSLLNKRTAVSGWLQKAINRQEEGIETPTLLIPEDWCSRRGHKSLREKKEEPIAIG